MYIDMNVAGFGCHSGGISHKATAEKLVFFYYFPWRYKGCLEKYP